MFKLPAFLLTVATTTAVATLVPVLGLQTDFSTLPPDPFQMEQTLSSSKLGFAAASKIAEDKVNGSCASLITEVTPEGVRYLATVFSDGKRHDMVISGADGSIISDREIARFPGDAIGDAEMVTLDSGLMYYELSEGDGATPPDSTAEVTVHYSGWLTDGTKFDSSVDRGAPVDDSRLHCRGEGRTGRGPAKPARPGCAASRPAARPRPGPRGQTRTIN